MVHAYKLRTKLYAMVVFLSCVVEYFRYPVNPHRHRTVFVDMLNNTLKYVHSNTFPDYTCVSVTTKPWALATILDVSGDCTKRNHVNSQSSMFDQIKWDMFLEHNILSTPNQHVDITCSIDINTNAQPERLYAVAVAMARVITDGSS